MIGPTQGTVLSRLILSANSEDAHVIAVNDRSVKVILRIAIVTLTLGLLRSQFWGHKGEFVKNNSGRHLFCQMKVLALCANISSRFAEVQCVP